MIARSTGAAPRQRGSAEGCRLTSGYAPSSGDRRICPNATTTPASASGGSALASCGCVSGSASSRAAAATGGAVSARPRPLGRSGWLTTAATCTAPRSTSARSTSAPNSDVPK